MNEQHKSKPATSPGRLPPAEPQPTAPVVLTGRLLPLGGRRQLSGMIKTVAQGPWRISDVGIAGDQQADLLNHGGAEKAVHQYPFDHQAAWRREIGPHPLLGTAGSFGENFSTSGWTEETVHVGDIVCFGSVLLQVSQGRQPCWKLNERFNIPEMASRVLETGRTGWYYRVLKTGEVQPGSSLSLLDRLQPHWPIARLTKLLFRARCRVNELSALADVPELSQGWRALARRRAGSHRFDATEAERRQNGKGEE